MPDQINRFEISTIVCTYDRAEKIFSTLDSLVNQTFPTSKFEIIIVDNHDYPNVDIQNVYTWFLEHTKLSNENHLKYVHQPLKGLSSARNAGIANSRGKILCFIDDDAVASHDWLETLMRAFSEHPETGIIGGHIILNIPEPRPKVLKPGFEIYWSHFVTRYADYTEVDKWDEFPWGANWCVRREAILKIGGFPLNYGRQGNNFGGGEELVAASLIQSLGYKIAILPQAVVSHNVEPNRYNLMHVWRTILSYTLVRYQAQKDHYIPIESTFSRTGRKARYVLQNEFHHSNSSHDREISWEELIMKAGAWLILLLYQLRDCINNCQLIILFRRKN